MMAHADDEWYADTAEQAARWNAGLDALGAGDHEAGPGREWDEWDGIYPDEGARDDESPPMLAP